MAKRSIAIFAALPLVSGMLFSAFSRPAAASTDADLCSRLKGRILLQVEKNGEAWYVEPNELRRYYLGRPDDAFGLMREKSLGVSNTDFSRFENRMPAKLAGRIIMKAEDRGQAYYVNPSDLKAYYLGRPNDAFEIMRKLSTGIKDSDLELIEAAGALKPSYSEPAIARTVLSQPAPILEKVQEHSSPEEASFENVLAEKAFGLINDYREKSGLPALVWNDKIAAVTAGHSRDMASGKASFSHDGFDSRVASIKSSLNVSGAAENIAWNQGVSDPATRAVEQWLGSSGHKKNIEGEYKYSGLGVAKSPDGKYYFAQIFVK